MRGVSIKEGADMPTCTRLLLTLREGEESCMTGQDAMDVDGTNSDSINSDSSTHVYDTVSTRRGSSTAAAAREALLRCSAGLPPALVDAVAAQLQQAAASPGVGSEVGSVEVGHGLRLEQAREYCVQHGSVSVLEGAASFLVCEQAVGSRLRGLSAKAEVNGQTLQVIALVHGTSKPERERPALHFVGPSGGALQDVRALELGKRSNSQMRTGPTSHFLRRQLQMQAHTAAMRDAYCNVDTATTKRAHSLLMDAYVSEAEHAGRKLRCVSLFV